MTLPIRVENPARRDHLRARHKQKIERIAAGKLSEKNWQKRKAALKRRKKDQKRNRSVR